MTGCRHTNDQRTVKIEGSKTLVDRFVHKDWCLLVDLQHRLLAVAFDVDRMPTVIIEWIGRDLLQDLDAVSNVKAELDDVLDWRKTIKRLLPAFVICNL